MVERLAGTTDLQLLELRLRRRNAVIAACDLDLRYVRIHAPESSVRAEEMLGRRDDELTSPDAVAELVALKKHVLETGEETRRRVRVGTDGGEQVFDVTAVPMFGEDGEMSGVATAALDVTPDGNGPDLLTELSTRLGSQVTAITEHWHARLRQRLSIRPQKVFPGDELLDGMPGVVGWLAQSLQNGHELDTRSLESLRGVAEHWWRAGHSIEEALLHLRILGDILHDALEEAVEDFGPDLEPARVVAASRKLSDALATVKVVLVGGYRDSEEERFRDFGSMLAHEVRDPVAAALTAARLIRMLEEEDEEASAEKRTKLLRQIERSLEHADRMVTSVHRLRRAGDEEEAEWTMEPLCELVDEILRELRDEADPAVEVGTSGRIPALAVPSEPVRLVLHNLVENGIKHADPERPERWVRVSCEELEATGELFVRVEDNGVGIAAGEQERIFRRFHRARDTGRDGFGLGLAIAREAARQTGGDLTVSSEPGVGSTFSLRLPGEVLGDG